MWVLLERAAVKKDLRQCPEPVRKTYAAWRTLVIAGGSAGLRQKPGLHDEALRGQLTGLRSSRLGSQYRVVYMVHAQASTIEVVAVTPHAYEKIRR
jgi:mRNA-degrading endonuclease RelE of RelBE toxin-antitoxin system